MKPMEKPIAVLRNKWVLLLAVGSLLGELMLTAASPVTTFAAGPLPADAAASGGAAVNPGQVDTLKPLWSVITDDYREQGTAWQHRTALHIDKGIVATITSGQLVAMQVSSGKRLWKFGGNLVSYVYSDSYHHQRRPADGRVGGRQKTVVRSNRNF